MHGLHSATHLNNLVGAVVGYNAVSERYDVRVAPCLAPVFVKAQNLMHPARCPNCSSEITGSQCFACPLGELVLHKSLRIGTPSQSAEISSHTSHTHMDFLPAASLTPEGPGSHSGKGLQLHACNETQDDT